MKSERGEFQIGNWGMKQRSFAETQSVTDRACRSPGFVEEIRNYKFWLLHS
jgi:hypothetical protein